MKRRPKACSMRFRSAFHWFCLESRFRSFLSFSAPWFIGGASRPPCLIMWQPRSISLRNRAMVASSGMVMPATLNLTCISEGISRRRSVYSPKWLQVPRKRGRNRSWSGKVKRKPSSTADSGKPTLYGLSLEMSMRYLRTAISVARIMARLLTSLGGQMK